VGKDFRVRFDLDCREIRVCSGDMDAVRGITFPAYGKSIQRRIKWAAEIAAAFLKLPGIF